MDPEALLDIVLLAQLPGVGERTARRVLERNAERRIGLRDFFCLPEATLRDDYALAAVTVRRMREESGQWRDDARVLHDQMAAGGVTARLASDASYPTRWGRLPDRPPIVFSLGADSALAGDTVAVLNSRGLNDRAVMITIRVIQAAAGQGLVVVSGGMKATHRVAAVVGRAAPARVIVLDRGLFAAFGRRLDRDPFGLGPGRAALDAARTLVLSPFRLRDAAVARNGPRRDELVAALADVVVAVTTRPGGEIERICFEALDRGQCVLSWQGENAGLVAAGAIAIGEEHLPQLRGFVARVDD